MPETTFTLAATTDLDRLVSVDHPELAPERTILADMLKRGDFGTYKVDFDDVWPVGLTRDSAFQIMFFIGHERAAIEEKGEVIWTVAYSLADAGDRYIRYTDELHAPTELHR